MTTTADQVSADKKEQEIEDRFPRTWKPHERKALLRALFTNGNDTEQVCLALPNKSRRGIQRCIRQVFGENNHEFAATISERPRTVWSDEELARFEVGVRTHGKRFGLIADGIHTTKTARQCELQYKKWARTADLESVEMAETLAPSRAAPELVVNVRRRQQWPESDNQKLMGLVLEHGIDWSKLAEAMGRGKTHVQKHVRDLYTRTKQTEWKYQIEAAEIIGEYYESNKKQVIDKQQAATICAAVLEVGAAPKGVFAKLNGSIPLKQLRKYIQNHNLKRALESYQREVR